MAGATEIYTNWNHLLKEPNSKEIESGKKYMII
jgi:hypothetical protein